MNVQQRIAVEKRITKLLVTALIDASYTISVCDGEEFTIKRSVDVAKICAALMTTDQDTLRVRSANGTYVGTVLLVYGNDGYDVIADYSISLEHVLEPIHTLINAMVDRAESPRIR